ncbi:type II secretion system F family protein [Pirellulaceae bacterium SH449]
MNSERPDYLRRIDKLLQERNSVADFVQSGLRDIGERRYGDLKRNLNALRGVTQAEQLLTSPHLLRLLPLLNSAAKRDQEALLRDAQALIDEEGRIATRWGRVFSYPSMMLLIIFSLFVIQAFLIAPTFEKMFAEFQLRLVYLTKAVFWLSRIARDYVWLIIPFIVLVHFGGGLVRYWLSLLVAEMQKYPIFDFLFSGRTSNLIAMSRFMRVLADLFELGTPIHIAIRDAGIASQHALYRLRADQLAYSLETSSVRRQSWEAFPPYLSILLQRDGGGERSTRLLRQMATTYRDHALLATARNFSITSPWLILFLGVMVLLFIAAYFAPLISLITHLG